MDNTNIKVGKYTLESLTTGMYSDPMIIFREYIQNSTDSIDIAIKESVLEKIEDSEIRILIDEKKQCITINDNGYGIPSAKAWHTLCDIGNSEKDISSSRGFRGIGRLGGLSYARKLIFETSHKGESKKSKVIWDCEKLRELIRPGEHSHLNLQDVIGTVATLKQEDDDINSHYFKVHLLNIDNKYPILYDKKEVKKYIEQVAPIPFDPRKFPYSMDCQTGLITKLKELNKKLEEYFVYIDDDPNPLYKAYKSRIESGSSESSKYDEIKEIRYFHGTNSHGETSFCGWYSISNFLGYIKNNSVSGIRFRKKNIQVGDSRTMDEFFTQTRFNQWFVGEVHIYDNQLIPNARRDNFEKNDAYEFFKKQLKKIITQDLSKLPSHHSAINSATKKINKGKHDISVIEEKIKNGVSSLTERKKLFEKRDQLDKDLNKAKANLQNISKKINKPDKVDELIKETDSLVKKNNKLENRIINSKFILDKEKTLSHLSKDVKKVVIQIFSVIDNNIQTKDADLLKNAIIDSLKNKKKVK